MSFGGEARLTLARESIPPAADRTGGGFDMAGHLAHTPSILEEDHGHTTADFQLLFGAFGSHMTLIGICNRFL
jgi:hypothetical protein